MKSDLRDRIADHLLAADAATGGHGLFEGYRETALALVDAMLSALHDRPHIILDPAQNFGQPFIASTGVKVADILSVLDADEHVRVVMEEYGVSRADILICCWFEARYGTGPHPRDEWLDWWEEWEPFLHRAKAAADYDMIPLPPFKHCPDPSIARGRHL